MCSAPHPPERASREEVLTSHRLGEITRRSPTAIASSGFLLGHMFSPAISEAFQRSQTALPAPPRTRSRAGGRSRRPRGGGVQPALPVGHHPQHPPYGAALRAPGSRPPADPRRRGWAGQGGSCCSPRQG